MKKLAILVDSFSGQSKQYALDQGLFYIASRLYVDGKQIPDDGTLDSKIVSETIKNGKEVKTSQPNLAELEDTFKKLSKDFDEVIYLCTGSGLSGTYATAFTIAKDFKNINVFNSNIINCGFYIIAKEIKRLFKAGKSVTEIKKCFDDFNAKTHVFVIPKDLEGFRKGGRLGPKSQYVLNKINIIPILEFTDAVRVKTVRRSMAKASNKAVHKIIDKIGGEKEIPNYTFLIAHTNDEDTTKIGQVAFAKNGIIDVTIEVGAGIVMAHTGVGAIALACFPKIKK